MMRWLKDKKKEKRTNSSGQEDDGKEDDYGFEKEKTASKSPSTRRELPPTPAAPEEKSPHIYEEIPDLSLTCSPDGGRVILQSKSPKSRVVGKTGGPAASSGHSSGKHRAENNDDISPYMVVPVDKEVRQTPTNFHRNGTPEVHCDVIVKDTHWEILLTRKPKVGAFKLDSANHSSAGESSTGKNGVRNNTHYCSRDRRASVDVHSAGKFSSAFSMTSSAMSSASTSRVNSMGASSSMSLSNFSEHQPMQTCEENESGGSRASSKGVMTYTSASNFIARATKLTFNPLPGKDPRKEAFGSDSSDGSQCVGYPTAREENNTLDTNGVSYSSIQNANSAVQGVSYASIQNQQALCTGSSGSVNYASIQDQMCTDTKLKYNSSSYGHQPPSIPNPSVRTGIIRPSSPSNSSTCTYASVHFPVEPRHYNTIPDLIPLDSTGNDCGKNGNSSDNSDVFYSQINGNFGTESNYHGNSDLCDNHNVSDMLYPRKRSFRNRGLPVDTSRSVSGYGFQDQERNDSFSIQGTGGFQGVPSSHSVAELNRTPNTYNSIDNMTNSNSSFRASDHCGNNFQLEFCSCSDEHSSSCGCHETKAAHGDDTSSVTGATNDGPSSCKGCGRLIRQITYSESYSDETYDHAYSSRLLIRTGRRFSSPDITFSEISNSEFQEAPNSRSPEFMHAMSRDDTWATYRSDDIIPPAYGACDDNGFVSSRGSFTHLRGGTSEMPCGYSGDLRLPAGHISNTRLLLRQNTSPASSDTSSITGVRTSTSSNSILLMKNRHDNVRLGFQTKNMHPDKENSMRPGHPLCTVKSFNDSQTEPARKRSAMAMLEPKSNAFSGLFSKFSKTKASKSSKRVENESKEPLLQVVLNDQESTACDKELEEIPDRNTKKLSKFFSRLSNKEVGLMKGSFENLNLATPDAILHRDEETACCKTSISAFKPVANEISGHVSQQALFNDETNQFLLKHQVGVSEDAHHPNRQSNEKRESKFESQTPFVLGQSLDALQSTDCSIANPGNGDQTSGKPQNKTDSGDTCYEYDISTSSEGEQTSYDCFLSSVKKTLNLDHEVQHIADSSFARKKLLCKRCKREELYSTIDDGEDGACSSDGFCPHLSAKFGDLRAIFDDLVVDQRAAILDCLTDYAHSPYNIKCQGHESHCRECGCEIMTSDSESLTTVYSLLSQQFRMTSPSGHTPSCDSDEGTMADNSGESGDEEGDEIRGNRNNDDSDKSSGYDEPESSKLERTHHKNRKRDKKDKKSPTSSNSSSLSKGYEKSKAKNIHGAGSTKHKYDGIGNVLKTRSANVESSIGKQGSSSGKDAVAPGLRKNVLRKNSFSFAQASSKNLTESQPHVTAGLHDDETGHSKVCNVSKSRMSMISDKALQDIYAPLPSKALSLLTSRNHAMPPGMPCTCGRGLQASVATMAAHPAIIESNATRDTKVVKSLPSHPKDFSGEEKDGVISVQTHLEREGQKNVDGGLFVPTGRKDCDDGTSEGRNMGVHVQKEFTTPDSTIIKKAEFHDGHSSPTKPGSNSPTKERTPASAKEGLSQRSSSSTKHNYDSGNQSAAKMGETRPFANCESGLIPIPHPNTERSVSEPDQEVTRSAIDKRANENDKQLASFLTSEENTKSKYSRKQLLKLATLDLLPETALGGDVVETQSEQKNVPVRPKRSKVVEKMAKVFEVPAENSSISNKKGSINNVNSERKNKCKLRPHKANNSDTASSGNNKGPSSVQSSAGTSQPSVNEKLKSDSGEFLTNTGNSLVPKAKETLPDPTQRSRPVSQDNLCGDAESRNLNLNETPPASDSTNLLVTSKTRTSAGRSKQEKENETKPYGPKSNNDMLSAIKNDDSKSKSGTGKTSITKLSATTECRHSKQKSPTPSVSSSSSSSSSKRKNGHLKHKKLSKKSYHRKRSKSRSERNKSNPGREERTCYYFSSDLSDIDVVEVEDWETYTTKLTPTTKSSHSKKSERKKRTSDTGSVKTVSTELKAKSSKSSQRSAREVDEDEYEQEIYAIPPSSSELRGRRTQDNPGEASPELPKPRKTQRTDVYKTRKSDNKLLSDLIIRNYDMQIYGNV